MPLQFQQPFQLQEPEAPDIVKTLDTIFNQAIRQKLAKEQIANMQQERQLQLGGALTQGLQTGVNPLDLAANPQAVSQALAGDEPTTPFGQRLKSLAEQSGASRTLGLDKQRAEIKATEAKTKNEEAMAALNQKFSEQLGGGNPNTNLTPTGIPGVFQSVLPSGETVTVQAGPRGVKITPMAGQVVTAEAAKNISNADSGIRQIGKIRAILNSPEGQSAILKAGGAGATIFSLGDTVAQNLKTSIDEASDVLARLRTGAQINLQEMDIYNALLSNRYRTVEANLNSLDIVEQFLKELKQQLVSGKRKAGSPGGEPTGESLIPKTATNKKTGQKLVSFDNGETWKPVGGE